MSIWKEALYNDGMRDLKRCTRAAAIAALLLLSAPAVRPASAISSMPESTVCLSGYCFTAQETAGPERLPLRGVSTYRYYGMKLFTAALYAPSAAQGAGGVLSDVPKRLVIRYHRKIGKQHLVKAAEHNLKGLPEARLATLWERIDRLNSSYQDVDRDDEYALVYVPGRGTTLERNGQEVITVEGQDLAQDYFGIWLSARSINHRLTHELLGIHPDKRLWSESELSRPTASVANKGYLSVRE